MYGTATTEWIDKYMGTDKHRKRSKSDISSLSLSPFVSSIIITILLNLNTVDLFIHTVSSRYLVVAILIITRTLRETGNIEYIKHNTFFVISCTITLYWG